MPRLRRHCVRWEGAPPKGAQWVQPLQFSAHVCCGQMTHCISIPLGTEVGLGPGDIVLDGDPAPPKRGTAPNFRPICGQTAGWIKMPLGTDAGPGPNDIVLDGPRSPKKGARPPIFGPCLLWPNGRRLSQLLLSSCS